MDRFIVLGVIVVVMVAVGLDVKRVEAQSAVQASVAGAYEQLSMGNQKIARALFAAQRDAAPGTGSAPLTLDAIAAQRASGQGWGQVFQSMRSRGLVTERSLGQVVSAHIHRHQTSMTGTLTTAAGRTQPVHVRSGLVSAGRHIVGDDDRTMRSSRGRAYGLARGGDGRWSPADAGGGPGSIRHGLSARNLSSGFAGSPRVPGGPGGGGPGR